MLLGRIREKVATPTGDVDRIYFKNNFACRIYDCNELQTHASWVRSVSRVQLGRCNYNQSPSTRPVGQEAISRRQRRLAPADHVV